MQALGKNVIVRRTADYTSQKSSVIMTIEPEWRWHVLSVGSEVTEIKVGDRVLVAAGKQVEIEKDTFRVPIESIIAVFTE